MRYENLPDIRHFENDAYNEGVKDTKEHIKKIIDEILPEDLNSADVMILRGKLIERL